MTPDQPQFAARLSDKTIPENTMRAAFDKHSIETPEQMPLEFAVAGIGSRFLALAIDTLIQLGALVALVIVVIILGVSGALSRLAGEHINWMIALGIFILFLLNFGYFAFFEVIWNGQTPGKRRVGLRVIKDSGRPLSSAETIARNFLRIVDQLPQFYALGMVVALCNKRYKRIGDLVVGSMVIRETPFDKLRPAWQAVQAEAPAAFGTIAHPATLGMGALSVQDLTLIETFLQRRYELTPDVRSRMASDILDRIKRNHPAAAFPDTSTESVLELVAQERRSSAGYS